MKKILTLTSFFLLFMLSACSGNSKEAESAEVEPVGKQDEMTKEDALNYLDEITYRIVEASLEKEGSFAQRSSLQAAIGRSEAITKEITDKYNTSPLVEEILVVANHVEAGAQKGLEENYILLETHLSLVIKNVKDISAEYLNDELPIPIKVLEQ